MGIRTHWFYQTGHIAGIPGEFCTGQVVDVDEDTMTVMATRLMNTPMVLLSEPAPELIHEGSKVISESARSANQETQPLRYEPNSEDVLE